MEVLLIVIAVLLVGIYQNTSRPVVDLEQRKKDRIERNLKDPNCPPDLIEP